MRHRGGEVFRRTLVCSLLVGVTIVGPAMRPAAAQAPQKITVSSHYHFVVYALDAPIATKPGQIPLTRAELLDAMKGHVIGQGELVATYERK